MLMHICIWWYLQEGYNPHLTDKYGTRHFSARPADMILADSWLDSSDPNLVFQQEYHRNRLLDAINTGQFTTEVSHVGSKWEGNCEHTGLI